MTWHCIRISIHALLAESDHNRRSRKQRHPNFYPRSPCGERLADAVDRILPGHISIHALLAESDADKDADWVRVYVFLSTLSLRRATNARPDTRRHDVISIHALLAESDCLGSQQPAGTTNFYPRSPCGERRIMTITICIASKFLSTLSLRRATNGHEQAPYIAWISIHALLAESDYWPCVFVVGRAISIHALLAESDISEFWTALNRQSFLSTLSLRRATEIPYQRQIDQQNFYPRSPCGERHKDTLTDDVPTGGFLSTLSLRRATTHPVDVPVGVVISIHALLAESDVHCVAAALASKEFLSTLSLRRATTIWSRPQHAN